MSKIIVIGSGFSGLSAASYLASAGHEVHVFEKNSRSGGRARQFETDEGYVFDMGPSWYWMPDIYEQFFKDFNESISSHYKLHRLDPAFQIIFGKNERLEVPDSYDQLKELFESIEAGSSERLDSFMDEAAYKYKAGVMAMSNMPGLSIREFADVELLKAALRLQIFSTFSLHVRQYFSNPKLLALMDFPVLFLGAMPNKIPAMYSLMNYAGLKLGTWYPEGGFGAVVHSIEQLARRKGAVFHFDSPVHKIKISNSRASSIVVNGEEITADAIIASADYQHVEEKLLPSQFRNYSNKYWSKKTFAPSSLIFYLGIRKKIGKLQHHNLFFDEDINAHSKEIYENPKWPNKPLFYVCTPSKTDDKVAPQGHENIFMLMPLAPGLEDTQFKRDQYFNLMVDRLEGFVGEKIRGFIDYNKSYCINDFVADYNSYKGNAYGLANTLRQTAILKPSIRNKKLKNLFYTGQLTIPGPGVPPALISGKVVAHQVLKHLKSPAYETVV